jgi:hypothetical protein
MKRAVTLLCAAALLASCATRPNSLYVPIVDPAIGDQAKLEAAIAECRSYAAGIVAQRDSDTAAAAFVGAALGIGLGAMFGLRGSAMYAGGLTSGLVGGANAAERGAAGEAQVIQRCLANRGYSVLK